MLHRNNFFKKKQLYLRKPNLMLVRLIGPRSVEKRPNTNQTVLLQCGPNLTQPQKCNRYWFNIQIPIYHDPHLWLKSLLNSYRKYFRNVYYNDEMESKSDLRWMQNSIHWIFWEDLLYFFYIFISFRVLLLHFYNMIVHKTYYRN